MSYTKEDLKKLYKNNPNEIAKIFSKAGYTDEYIEKLFNSASEDVVLLRAEKISEKLKIDKEYYNIPIEYKKAEYDFFQDDRNLIYDEMNNSIDLMIGKKIQSLYDYDQENYYTGIHRTINSPNVVFSKGINVRANDLSSHVQIMGNLPLMLREIKNCNNYKGSLGCYIVKIPKKGYKYNGIDPVPLFYKSEDGELYLRPEFILAYVPVYDRELTDVVFNKENHDIYSEETEFYTDETVKTIKFNFGFINILSMSAILILIITIIFILK